MAVRGVDHIDLAVSDVEASLAFYLGLLGPLGLKVEGRFNTYRGTETSSTWASGRVMSRGPRPRPASGSDRQMVASTVTTTSESSTSPSPLRTAAR